MTQRADRIRKSIRENMLFPRTKWVDPRSVFEEHPESADKPLILRNAIAVKMKLEGCPICLWSEQLIAGSMVDPIAKVQITGSLPDHATAEEKEAAAKEGVTVGTIVGHIVPSYPKLLRLGTNGIRDQALSLKETATDSDSKAFYEACAIVMDALSAFSKRHAAMICDIAKTESDAQRTDELHKMAEALEFVPANPAQTFYQASAAIWITHLAFQLTGNGLAIGRFDQHTWKYLQADIESGALNEEQAQEIVDCFMLKFNERSIDNSIPGSQTDFEAANAKNLAGWAKRTAFDHATHRKNVRDDIDSSNHWLQNVIVGGVKPEDGTDASNPVTYMVLEAFDRNRMTNPCLTVRLHNGTPETLYKKSCETLINGGGLPAFFNDEGIVPALTKWGFPVEDARDYTNDGCWEVILAGRNDFYFDRFNMLRCLEWALNHGKSRIDGKREAIDVGDAADFDSYEKVFEAFLKELYFEIEGLMKKNDEQFGRRYKIAPVPLLSALLEGPMELGGDMTQRGAKYVTYGLIAEGVSHVIDSFAAIKKVIFDEKYATMVQLADALAQNFEGYEELRVRLMASPKYGRNEKSADDIGKEILDLFAEKVRELNPKYNKITYLPGAGTFSWYIAIGEGVGATPDGRLSGEAVSSNLSPSAGAATRGITGSILSHASFDMASLPVGSPADLRLSSKLVEGEGGMERLMAVVKSFVKLGGNMLTLTIADTQLLRAAQKNPEQYRDLRVRMGGWSAYFTMLSKDQQEHHIQKAEEI